MTRYQPMYVQDGSYAASQDRRLLAALWPTARSTGCAVTVASGMTLNVAPGSVAVPTQNNTGSTLCVSDANEQVVIGAAPPSGQNRIDVVTCHPRDFDLDGSSNSDFIFDVVVGVPAATPVAPAVPAGQVALYQVTVPGGAAALVAGNLADVRPGALSVSNVPWLANASIHARMFRSAALNITNASGVLAFDTADTSNGNVNTPGIIQNLNTANARFVIPVPGRYLFSAMWSTSGLSSSYTMYTQLRKNGTNIGSFGSPWIGGQAQWGQGPAGSMAVICAAGDYLDVIAQTNIATACAMQNGFNTSFAILDYLGPIPGS